MTSPSGRRSGSPIDRRRDRKIHGAARDAVRLPLPIDVPVGITLSGGLGSHLAAVDMVSDAARMSEAFTFVTGDAQYDELPWVRQMLAGRPHPLTVCPLSAQEVPRSCPQRAGIVRRAVWRDSDARLREALQYARADDVIVLLDGQGWMSSGRATAPTRRRPPTPKPAEPRRRCSGGAGGDRPGVAAFGGAADCLVPEFRQRATAVQPCPAGRSTTRFAACRRRRLRKLQRALPQRSHLDALVDRTARAVPRSSPGQRGRVLANHEDRRQRQMAAAAHAPAQLVPGDCAAKGRCRRAARVARPAARLGGCADHGWLAQVSGSTPAVRRRWDLCLRRRRSSFVRQWISLG